MHRERLFQFCAYSSSHLSPIPSSCRLAKGVFESKTESEVSIHLLLEVIREKLQLRLGHNCALLRNKRAPSLDVHCAFNYWNISA